MFNITTINPGCYFTILGVGEATAESDVYAIQINTTSIRVYMAREFIYYFSKSIAYNTDYEMTLYNNGDGLINISIVDINQNETILDEGFRFEGTYFSHCNIIGNSFFGTQNQGSAGTIYSLNISQNSVESPATISDFDFSNTFNDVSILKSSNISQSGNILVTEKDSVDNLTLLTDDLTLRSSQNWTLESDFMITLLTDDNSYFTFIGVSTGDNYDQIFALQISLTQLRIYVASSQQSDNIYNLEAPLSYGEKYKFILSCDGNSNIHFEIINSNGVTISSQSNVFDGDIIVNGNVIGNSMFLGGNQGSTGVIYSLRIS